ncbi:poly-gamma-glutamate hydrolase family protein [Rhodomicrobium sp.]|uniref:poly-gamma-glutamate hydrolase family protein n=1 Tax=Rhodomicrobium sp. TaxID=2720632 RepID=UPI0039E7035A
MVQDRFESFYQLSQSVNSGRDYRIRVDDRGSPMAVIAPHGGRIELRTSDIASSIAANVHSLYCFEGVMPNSFENLHITSTKFDEPACLKLIATCDFVIAVHGMRGDEELVEIGGLDHDLKQFIQAELSGAGFNAVQAKRFPGLEPKNICNRGKRHKGVQLEISKGLRNSLAQNDEALSVFAECVRNSVKVD